MNETGQERNKSRKHMKTLQQNKILLSLLVIFKCILMIIPWFLEVRTLICIMRSITLVTRPIRLGWSWSWRGCRCQRCQQSTLRFVNFFSGRKACRVLQALEIQVMPQDSDSSFKVLRYQNLQRVYQLPIQRFASQTTERTKLHIQNLGNASQL